ncbi:MAG: DUF4395 domain-containing protein [Gammaproteobacteria bacterium]|uniref:DUF4395 domain-containing protein n=1 Tax=Hydrogenophaga sp. TaxID=1904254 RepID=UPI0025BB71E6|nr:DUF4395 domain-containing protein [Hydrogenophaga sp.]MBU4181359.1 DUF4395 domain-containing protein [Gammaproteobacteria bacterium]MBU4279727.1 DUF4395 domain-containing protein [Gammaproteobacteria bacterium]MBU4323660.1 DUF4395 domain-containing protein [Gammaproteobacteria bacterium]MBU4507422.1 DUF4395 domain-containing protein [Gammaproteobacteria bacterium]MCG2655044.1 DUF4395 domain-containing protein [Hydrogenophaga sp.]
MNELFQFGETVEGYPVRVVNERTVRAAAGLLFFPAVVSFMNALLTANYQPTRLFVIVFLIDMTLRMLNPRWAPSMIVGGWIVRKQTPDWVGAPQKRFAWGLGLLLGLAMLYLMVLNRFMGPVNMLVCASCLTLMFFETAFGICLGCKLYNVFNREKAQLCPGGVCEMPAPKGWGVSLPQAAVLVLFVGTLTLAKAWVDETGPLGGFDDMATLEDMGLKPTPGEASAADAERCQVPAFARAIGHEETWKQHNGCS